MTDDVQENNLPSLKELNASAADIRDWRELPVTRLWFKSLIKLVLEIRNDTPMSYNRESAEETHAKLAERIGAMRVLYDLIESVQENERLFSEKDIEEAVSEYN